MDTLLDTESMTEEVNRRVLAASAELNTAIEEYAGHILPFEAGRAAQIGLRFLSLAFSLDDGEHIDKAVAGDELAAWDVEDWDSFARLLPDVAVGKLLLALRITDDFSEPRKHLAVDVAETLGPDVAQAWYRFIVLVTKLA